MLAPTQTVRQFNVFRAMTVPAVILASTSPYRRELLARIVPAFGTVSPQVDESAQSGEPPVALAIRLARAKAAAVAALNPGAIVIGSDQVADLDGEALGKPGDAPRATEQLRRCSGRTIAFHTAVCVVPPDGVRHEASDLTRVRFRTLAGTEIAAYVERERPFDCAGSFKAEGLGIALFEAIESSDPTALIGLPLIATCRLLRAAGFDPLAAAAGS
jgi:septum formation protein